MADQPRDATGAAPLTLAGKTLARRQLEFALAAGCEGIIALGDGASAEAIALRHAAEAAGARFQAVRDSHDLLGAIRADDELLALAPGLLPEAAAALEMLGKGRKVLVLPAAAGVAAGFERIDLERAWAGALLVGGAPVERLSDLPADVEPTSALVRIALQAHVAERRLPAEVLADGSWTMLDTGVDTAFSEKAWLDRHLPSASPFEPSRWLARTILRPLATRLLANARSVAILLAAVLAALAGSVLATGYGLAPLGFALLVVGAILSHATSGLLGLARAPRWRDARSDFGSALSWAVDAALLVGAVLAIDGSWFHRLFPPLVLLGTLRTFPPATPPTWQGLTRDRGLLALSLGLAAAFGLTELAVMALSLVLVALNLAQSRAQRG